MRIILLLALIACSKTEPDVFRGSCQATATCEDYESKTRTYIANRKQECKDVGTWSDKACPTANLVGSCRESHGWSRTRHHYAGAQLDLPRVKAQCGAYGTWIEPAAR